MISIPVAVYKDMFRWELDLFWYNHKLVYGDGAHSKAMAIIIERNFGSDPEFVGMQWNTSVPYKICKPFFEYLNLTSYTHVYAPLNIQVGLAQIVGAFDDEEILEILDCDMFHLKKMTDIQISDSEILVDTIYEDWHLKSMSANKYVIQKYLKHDTGLYNGGFVPIICKAKVLKKILPDWIDAHLKILNDPHDNNMHWWAGMFALQIACDIHSIKMVSADMCYIPNANELSDNHHIAHYSVDPIFHKHSFPHINWDLFKNNVFYDRVRSWYHNSYLNW